MSIPPILSLADNPEESRRLYLHHERSVRFVGNLYLFAAVMFGLAAVVGFFTMTEPLWARVLTGVICLGVSVACWLVGRGLCRLDSRVIIPATILAAIGLLGFCIATIVSGYTLYLIHSKKGHVVFSHEYKTVIEATPHVQSGSFLILWIVLILAMTVLVVAPLIIVLTM